MANEILEQEISALEDVLAEKRAQLEHEQTELPPQEQERELIRDIVGNQIQQQTIQQDDETPVPITLDEVDEAPAEEAVDAMASQVQALVNVAFEKSMKDAIAEAVKTKNPALIDAFHDALVDDLYDELLKRKKVEKP